MIVCVCVCVVGLIDGYTGERLALEQQVKERAELQLHLEQELRITSSRLHELEHERQQIQRERELLSRQQDAMRDGAGSRELRMSHDVYYDVYVCLITYIQRADLISLICDVIVLLISQLLDMKF